MNNWKDGYNIFIPVSVVSVPESRAQPLTVIVSLLSSGDIKNKKIVDNEEMFYSIWSLD